MSRLTDPVVLERATRHLREYGWTRLDGVWRDPETLDYEPLFDAILIQARREWRVAYAWSVRTHWADA